MHSGGLDYCSIRLFAQVLHTVFYIQLNFLAVYIYIYQYIYSKEFITQTVFSIFNMFYK